MAKILVVEDNPEVSKAVTEWLEHERHLVEIAENGVDALDLLLISDFELVILDWDLPKLSGLEVCKRYRAEGKKSPVLMLTGKGSIDEKEAALDVGADDYLTKPFHPRELLARVRALLRRPVTVQSNLLEAGHVSLDGVSRRVTVNGQEIALAPKEFALLEFLMRYPNEVFSDEAIVNRVWGSYSEVSPDNVVRKNIRRLREKLDLDGCPSLIRTVYGVGYQLVPPEPS